MEIGFDPKKQFLEHFYKHFKTGKAEWKLYSYYDYFGMQRIQLKGYFTQFLNEIFYAYVSGYIIHGAKNN